jgi:hypothetical protein
VRRRQAVPPPHVVTCRPRATKRTPLPD